MSAGSVLHRASDTPKPPRLPPVDFNLEKALADAESLVLLESDGMPMESYWHVTCMHLLIDQVEQQLHDRDDFVVGGNMFAYFSVAQAKNLDYRGPDFFYVSNTTREPMRRYWVVWEEKRTPNVVIELASPTTRDEDYGPKFAIYRDRLRVNNYFIYDPETRVLDGWVLQGTEYIAIEPDANGRLWSDQLQLHLGEWEGKHRRYDETWLRFFDADGNVIPTLNEAAKQRADERADAAEAEIARLKALLAQTAPTSKNGSSNP